MTDPIAVDIPHKLGRDGARARIERGMAKLGDYVPGGTVTEQRWDGDTLHLTVEAFGQRVVSRIAVEEALLHTEFELPPLLALFGEKLREKLAKDGPKLLE